MLFLCLQLFDLFPDFGLVRAQLERFFERGQGFGGSPHPQVGFADSVQHRGVDAVLRDSRDLLWVPLFGKVVNLNLPVCGFAAR